MSKVLRTIDNERGATLALLAVISAAVVAVIALGVDLGMLWTARAEGQRSADAGALAGASAYRDFFDPNAQETQNAARTRALATATANRIRSIPVAQSEVTVTLLPAQQRVQVLIARASVTTFFARIFGISSVPVSASATAEAAIGGTSVTCLRPFLISDIWYEANRGPSGQDANSNYLWDFGTGNGGGRNNNGEQWAYETSQGDYYNRFDPSSTPPAGQQQTGWGSNFRYTNAGAAVYPYPNDYGAPILLKPQTGTSQRVDMFYQLMDMGNGNVRNYVDSYPCTGQGAQVGDLASIAPGGKTGQAKQGIDDLVALDPQATWDPATKTVTGSQPPAGSGISPSQWDWTMSPRVMTVALFDPLYIANGAIQGGNAQIPITNFVKLWAQSANGNNNISAIFLGFAGAGTGGGGTSTGTTTKYLRLVQ
jgi:hypothetical protein